MQILEMQRKKQEEMEKKLASMPKSRFAFTRTTPKDSGKETKETKKETKDDGSKKGLEK